MSPRITWATALRVLTQLRRDPRTIALLLAIPPLLLTLLKYTFYSEPQTFEQIGGPLVGLFPFMTMFLVTSITMLRERTTGTLERLMTMPLAKIDLLLGYGIAFAAVAVIQALITAGVAFGSSACTSPGQPCSSSRSPSATRSSGCRSACSPARLPARSSKRFNSSQRSSFRSSSSAACSLPAIRWQSRSRSSPTCSLSRTRSTTLSNAPPSKERSVAAGRSTSSSSSARRSSVSRSAPPPSADAPPEQLSRAHQSAAAA